MTKIDIKILVKNSIKFRRTWEKKKNKKMKKNEKEEKIKKNEK